MISPILLEKNWKNTKWQTVNYVYLYHFTTRKYYPNFIQFSKFPTKKHFLKNQQKCFQFNILICLPLIVQIFNIWTLETKIQLLNKKTHHLVNSQSLHHQSLILLKINITFLHWMIQITLVLWTKKLISKQR